MGGPMAVRLLDAGHALTVFDTSAEAVAPLKARGATVAASAHEVANSAEVVMMSLPTPPIVQAVCLGDKGILAGSTIKTLIDLSTTGPSVAKIVGAAAARAEHRVGRFAGQWRRHRCHQGHAGGDGVMRQADVRRHRAAAEDLRQDLLRRRQAGARADREARQQPAGRRGARPLVRGDGDGREGRPRRQGADRHHQRRQRTQQRHAGQVSRRRFCRARSISALPRGSRTRTCGCASTKPRRWACRWWPARRCGRCWR